MATTPFVGRTQELASLLRILGDPETRLLTLIGPPGVGKTRLAIELAARAAGHQFDVVHHAALAGVRDPASVAATILRDVGGRDAGLEDPLLQLIHALSERALLVIDNFEQVAEAAPDVAQLVAACPDLTVLATSRRPLNVRVERTAVVRPLQTPAEDIRSPGDIMAHDAVALLVHRLQAADSGFRPETGDAADLAAICRLLDGLPLAIELVAPRIRVLPLAEIAAALVHRLPHLARGPRDAPDRHRTMRDAIIWSYELLDETTARAFRQLSVFAGGWTIEGAHAVLPGIGETEVIDLLDDLVSMSLVVSAGTSARHQMLEVIRELGLEQLQAAGEAELARGRHAQHVLALAEAASGRLAGPELGPLLDRLEPERDNVRVAVRWAVDHGDAETALGLCIALRMLWYVRGPLREGRAIFDEALGLPTGDRGLRSRALAEASALARQRGELASAARLAGDAVAEARAANVVQPLTGALLQRGFIAHLQGDADLAQRCLDESAGLARSAGDELALARAVHHLGIVAQQRGDLAAADELLGQALQLYRRHDVTRQVAATLIGLAELAGSRQDIASATSHMGEALGILDSLRDVPILPYALQTAANLAAGESRPARAMLLLGAVDAVTRTSGAAAWPATVSATDGWLPGVIRKLGRQRAARLRSEGARLSAHDAIAFARDQDSDGLPDLLSGREHEVAALVASGLTNREIGARLFLSERTIDGHVAHILTKLDFNTRSQIAAWVGSVDA